MTPRAWRLAALGATVAALTLAGRLLHVPGADNVGSPALTNLFVLLLALAGVAFLLACRIALAPAPGLGAGAVLALALAIQAPPLLGPPFLSSDLYRYVWDGRVQDAGINPYRFIPADPALAHLRDATIYPNVNRRDYARTIYPPAAELVFAAVAAVSQTALAMKLAMLLAEAVGLAAMLVLLRRAALPPARLLLFAWNPLAAWTFAGNGHVDALAVAAVGLALLARGSRRQGLTGVLLGVAVLVKFLPAAIAPALWRRWGWRLPLATLATIVALYAIYAGAGRHVLGFLPQYTQEEGLTQGSGFWLVAGLGELVRLPAAADHVYIGVALAALLALALAVAFRARPAQDDAIRVARDAGLLAGALILAISPHYPWYFPWLGLFCCLAPMPELIYLSVAPLALYLDPLHERFLWPSVVYVPTLALAAARLAGRRAPV